MLYLKSIFDDIKSGKVEGRASFRALEIEVEFRYFLHLLGGLINLTSGSEFLNSRLLRVFASNLQKES